MEPNDAGPPDPRPITGTTSVLRWLFYAGFVIWFAAIGIAFRVWNDRALASWILVGVPVLFVLGLYVYGKMKYWRSRRP